MKTFKPKICKRCGREYIPTSGVQKYCGSQKLKTGCSYRACREHDRTPEHKETSRIYKQKPENKERERIRQQLPDQRLKQYKRRAKQNGLCWEIDNEFAGLLKQPCHYCGATHSIGVDRVDNSKGYTKENSVPCCKPINMMKGTLSKNEFFQLCKEVVIHNHLL